MKTKEKQIKANLEHLKSELEGFIDFFGKELDYNIMVYEFWNAKDILGHITFWHESFARNIKDLGNGIKPNQLKGKLSEVNNLSVETTKDVTIKQLIGRLKKAQKTIEEYIFSENIALIPYKAGSRPYSREEHLEIVTKHIHIHLNDLNKRYAKTYKQN